MTLVHEGWAMNVCAIAYAKWGDGERLLLRINTVNIVPSRDEAEQAGLGRYPSCK